MFLCSGPWEPLGGHKSLEDHPTPPQAMWGHELFEALMKKKCTYTHKSKSSKQFFRFVDCLYPSNPLLVNLKLGTGLPGCPVIGLVDHSSWTFLGHIYLYVGSSATCSHVVSSCLFRFDCTKSSLLCASPL